MMPNPDAVVYHLRKAIQTDERPAVLLHRFLKSGRAEANAIGNTLFTNKQAMRLLTSPAGRKYIHRWLDDTLDYLAKFAE
jgi:hypothetical protein